MSAISRNELHHLIDELPESVLADVAHFLEFTRFKLSQAPESSQPYVPVALGGLWHGVTITEADINTVRQEMWQGFGESSE